MPPLYGSSAKWANVELSPSVTFARVPPCNDNLSIDNVPISLSTIGSSVGFTTISRIPNQVLDFASVAIILIPFTFCNSKSSKTTSFGRL